MLFVKMSKTGLPLEVSEARPHMLADIEWKCRRDFKSLEEVKRLALYITAFTGQHYIGVDDGSHPRFDVVKVPRVGDEVSYCFNGDYYPDGLVTKVTKNLQVTTSEGHVYRRRKETGTWIQTGGTWSLVAGHIDERNSSF